MSTIARRNKTRKAEMREREGEGEEEGKREREGGQAEGTRSDNDREPTVISH